MDRFFLALTFLFSFSAYSSAQHYKTATGVRLGGGIGLTVQQYIGEKKTIEGIFSVRNSGDAPTNDLTLLVRRHFNLLTRRFNVYCGAGPHAFFLQKPQDKYENMYGVSFIGGGEFTMRRWNFSVDLKPAFSFSRGENQALVVAPIALSARYIFVERDSFKERVRKRFKRKT
jgi:hypothetical protein